MSKYNIDEELMKAFEDASLEDINKIMEDVDPGEFKISNVLAKHRIQNKVMNELNNKNREINFRGLGYVAAAIIVLSGLIFSRTEAGAAVFNKIFSFVPGKGIVETEEKVGVEVLEEGVGSDISVPTTIYELVERGKEDSNDYITVTYNNGTADGDTLELSYHFIMNFDDYEDICSIQNNASATDEDPAITLQKFKDYFNSMGFEDYITYTDDMKKNRWFPINGVQSSLYSDGTILPRLSSEYNVEEAAGGIEAEVTETYDISGATASEGSAYTLKIGDFESTFTVSSVSQYASEEDLLNDNNAVTSEGIQMICDTHWENELLIADFYVTDCGDYDSVIALHSWYFDEEKIYAEINGKKYDANYMDAYTFDSNDERPFHLAFTIPENERSGDIIIHVGALQVSANIDPIQIDFSGKSNGEFDINNTFSTSYGDIKLTKGFKYTKDTMPDDMKDYIDESDVIGVYFELDSTSDDPVLMAIYNCTYNNANIDDYLSLCNGMDSKFIALETSSLPDDGTLAITNVMLEKSFSFDFIVTTE